MTGMQRKMQATDNDALYHIWDLWINDLMLNGESRTSSFEQ